MGGSIFGFHKSLTLFLPIDRCRSVTVSAQLTAGLTNHHPSGHQWLRAPSYRTLLITGKYSY